MPDHLWVSELPESRVEPDIGRDLSGEPDLFNFYSLYFPTKTVDLLNATSSVPGDHLTIAVLYAGLKYEEGETIPGLWWAGWAGPKAVLRRMIANSQPAGRAVLNRQNRIRYALTLAKMMCPGIIPKEPRNVVAWSVMLP